MPHRNESAQTADAKARTADATARTADATARTADATARTADATARTADATARTADRKARTADATARIDTDQLLRLRLASQRITPPTQVGTGVADTVRHLLAVQAQDFGHGLWALGVRTPGSTRAQVLAELARGSVVRSWPMRGTLHFVAPEDLRWMLQLTAPRTLASVATRQRQLDLDHDTLDRSADLTRTELAGGGGATRAEFLAVLEDAGITTSGQRGYHIIWYLAQIGLICWGPPSQSAQAIVLLDEWAPAIEEVPRSEALRRFALRYFRGHGPATVKDFVWWSKLTITDAKEGLAAARDELIEVKSGGADYWMSAGTQAASTASPWAVHLLPGFDEFLLGYRDRSDALPPVHADRVVPGGNGIFLPMIVSRGRVVGTWRRTLSNAAVALTPEPFGRLTAHEAAGLARAAAAYAGYLGLPLTPVPSPRAIAPKE